MREDGVAVREWCNLLLIPLILESLLIIGSSFHHLANPEPCHSALQGSWGAGRKGGGGGEADRPHQESTEHTLLLHTSSFRSIKEKKRSREPRGDKKMDSLSSKSYWLIVSFFKVK